MRHLLALAASTTLLTLGLGGCPTPAPFVAPELPAGIAFVVNHDFQFAQFADTPDNTATPITDAGRLVGCWARVRLNNIVSGSSTTVDVYEALRFRSNGTVRQESLLSNVATGVQVLLISEGTYTLDAAGVLTIAMTTFAGNNPRTGAIEPIPAAQPTSTTATLLGTTGALFFGTTDDAGNPASSGFGTFTCQD